MKHIRLKLALRFSIQTFDGQHSWFK